MSQAYNQRRLVLQFYLLLVVAVLRAYFQYFFTLAIHEGCPLQIKLIIIIIILRITLIRRINQINKDMSEKANLTDGKYVKSVAESPRDHGRKIRFMK